MSSGTDNDRYVVLGSITGLFGIHGEVKIHSYTKPRENIFSYHPWYLGQGGEWIESRSHRRHGRGKILIAVIDGIEDRDEASGLVGADIAVRRGQLPALNEGEYYQTDLIGFEVIDIAGTRIGTLLEIEETGANDILVIIGERRLLIPVVMGEIIKNIDLDKGIIQVNWDPEYL
jgi:16S rRNA processing protein RimM